MGGNGSDIRESGPMLLWAIFGGSLLLGRDPDLWFSSLGLSLDLVDPVRYYF